MNIRVMVKNRRLAGKILDADWGEFLQLLEFKAERAGAPGGEGESERHKQRIQVWKFGQRL